MSEAPIPPVILSTKGLKLNNFADIPTLDFDRDVLSKLSAEQQATFKSFSAKLDELLKDPKRVDPSLLAPPHQIPDDFTRLRFLEADRYKVPDALARMVRTLEWRAETKLDEDMEAMMDPVLLARSIALRPRILVGYDKHNRPMMFEKLGAFFASDDAYKGLPMSQWIRTYAWDISILCNWFRNSVEHGRPYAYKLAYVGDLAGIRFFPAFRVVPFLKRLVQAVDAVFPEFAGPVTLINAPGFVAKLWGLVSVFLDPNTRAKVQICQGVPKDLLFDLYGEDVIPVEYGGKNPISIPGAPLKVDKAFDLKYPFPEGMVAE